MDKKKLRNDIILISSLLLVAAISLTIALVTRKRSNLIAKISVSNKLVETIDLSQNLDKYYEIDGKNGKVVAHTKDGAIAIVESTCPHKDCINMGYVSTSGTAIICAYNEVVIVIESSTVINDVEL